MIEFEQMKWIVIFAFLFGLLHVIMMLQSIKYFRLKAGIPLYGDKQWRILPSRKDFPVILSSWIIAAFLAAVAYFWLEKSYGEMYGIVFFLVAVPMFLGARLIVNSRPRGIWRHKLSWDEIFYFAFEAFLQSISMFLLFHVAGQREDIFLLAMIFVLCLAFIGFSEAMNLRRWWFIKEDPYRDMS